MITWFYTVLSFGPQQVPYLRPVLRVTGTSGSGLWVLKSGYFLVHLNTYCWNEGHNCQSDWKSRRTFERRQIIFRQFSVTWPQRSSFSPLAFPKTVICIRETNHCGVLRPLFPDNEYVSLRLRVQNWTTKWHFLLNFWTVAYPGLLLKGPSFWCYRMENCCVPWTPP